MNNIFEQMLLRYDIKTGEQERCTLFYSVTGKPALKDGISMILSGM